MHAIAAGVRVYVDGVSDENTSVKSIGTSIEPKMKKIAALDETLRARTPKIICEIVALPSQDR